MDDPRTLFSSLELISTKSANVVKIFMTSRDDRSVLQPMPPAHRIPFTATENGADVEQYIVESIDKLANERNLSLDMRKHIVSSLVPGAGETFQWAKLQLSQLHASKQPILEQDLPTELARLEASTLANLYDDIYSILIAHEGTAKELIIATFSWLLYARELLAVDAFLEIVAATANWKSPSPDGLIDVCRGFIYIDTQSKALRFVHQSVRAYLRAQPLLDRARAQTLISRSCLRILKEPPLNELTILQPRQRLYDYATAYLGHHISVLESAYVTDDLFTSIETFLFGDGDTGLYAKIWLETAESTFVSVPSVHPQKIALEAIISETYSPLFPICAFAMSYVLNRHAWPRAFDWNQRNKHGHTALYIAAYYGHTSVVSFLLDAKADPNITCGRLGTAIQCAAYRGHTDTTQHLLHRGADPKLPGKFPSAMHAACRGNHESIVLALLDSKYPISTQSEYENVLLEFARAGFAEALAELQTHPLATPKTVSRTQHLATEVVTSGSVSGLRYLLRKSTVADAITPGSLASSAMRGHEGMTIFLIDQGIDVDEQGDMGTPLRCASAFGYNNICKILLDRGADVNKVEKYGGALHAAAMRGHLHTVKLLLDLGADVNASGGSYGTALQAASYNGHSEVVSWLLTAKAYVGRSGLFSDAIKAAREGGRHDIVELFENAGHRSRDPIPSWGPRMMQRYPKPHLLKDSSPSRTPQMGNRIPAPSQSRGVPYDPFDPSMSFEPLQDTRTETVALQEERHDEPGRHTHRPRATRSACSGTSGTANSFEQTPKESHQALHQALDQAAKLPSAHCNSLADVFHDGPGAVVYRTLSQLPHEEVKDSRYGLVMEMAAAADQLEIIQLLIDRNIDVNIAGDYYGTSLQAASRYGHKNIVKALLCADADPNIYKGRYGTALRAAVMSYNVEVVCALLEYGANTELCGGEDACDGTALCLAVQEKQSEIVHALVTAGADVTSAARRKPLLIMACAWGNIAVVRALLDAGANVQVRGDTWYRTSEVSGLHAAIHAGHLDVVKLLLARGFDLNSTFDRAQSPLELAVEAENREALDAILDSLPHESLKTLTKGIRRAIYLCKPLLVEQFLDHPRTELSTDTVLDLALYACRMPSCEVVELLLDNICRRSDINLESTLAEINFQEGWVSEGNLETLFRYTPCTANIFVQACICGSLSGVQQGLSQGNDPHVEDSKGRPAFHFAAVHGRADVVKVLLDNGASATHMHTTYGTPLSITLEAWSAYLLHEQPPGLGADPNEKARAHMQDLTGLETSKYSDVLLDDPFDMSYLSSGGPDPRIAFRQARCVKYMSIVDLLMQNTADSYESTGRGRSTLALTAFLGLDELLDELLNCGISLTTSSEAFSSAFLAAIVGKQAGSVAKVAGIAPISVLDPGSCALHLACESCDLTIIRLLHTYGYHYNTRNGTGQTALGHCLVASRREYNGHPLRITPAEKAVIQCLLEAVPGETVSVEDMTAAMNIKDYWSREVILSILASSSQITYCSSHDFARLMRRHGRGVISSSDAAWQLLQNKCLPALTNEILALAHDTETVRALLDYDMSYSVDSGSLDDLGRYWDEVNGARSDSCPRRRLRRLSGRQFDGHRRNAMDLLFHRGNDVVPSEANVIKAMAVIGDPERCHLSNVSKMKSGSQNLIDSMFRRNTNLTVTEEMLTTVRDPSDLRALLAHTLPGSQVVTASVLGALITPRPNENREALFKDRTRSRKEAEKLLRVFLEFDPDVSVPPEVSQHFMDMEQIHDPSTLDVLLRHNPELQLSLEYILSAIEYRPRAKHSPKNFIQVLRKHKDRWECTAEVEEAIAESERQQAGRESRRKQYFAELEKMLHRNQHFS
ncbi:hypothetical protein KC340_g10500 [Hortaea werneckii]|nr:hypothetical protein KC342_g11008 [Hortaea werneckii]KAI7227826.1 hypothetical protein KC365_g8732 [Hortaea werneckii]KAI7310398.1 hypothetical protein KC340_g10500 [Hortaea werneckii]KAI7390144.1 hypothetical protein KC328_g8083 [Hortaea werneckii]